MNRVSSKIIFYYIHHLLIFAPRDPHTNMMKYFISHMECWVSKKGKKRAWSFSSKGFFCKMFKNEDFGFQIFENGQILRPFLSIAPSKVKKKSNKKSVGKIAHGRDRRFRPCNLDSPQIFHI